MTTPSRREQIHIRDRDGAVLAIAAERRAEARKSVGMWQRGESGLPVSGPLDRMIAIQCEAYPSDWSDADKREMAILHLFPNRETRD